MKRFLIAAAIAAIGTGASAAGTTNSTFNVTVAFTALCNVKTGATDIAFGTYIPFTNAAITDTSSSVTFRCSQGITPTAVSFVRVTGTAADMSASAAGTGAATAEGVLSGLRYTLAIPALAVTVAGSAATAGANGTGGVNSTAKEYAFPITATMPGSQAGGAGGDTSQTWQVLLAY